MAPLMTLSPRTRRKKWEGWSHKEAKVQLDPRPCPVEKLQYKTKKIARQAAANFANTFGFINYPYKCPHCHSWHLTKIEQK